MNEFQTQTGGEIEKVTPRFKTYTESLIREIRDIPKPTSTF